MQKQLAQVAIFQRAFVQNVATQPTLIDEEKASLRFELMQNLSENYTKAVNYRIATGLLGNAWNKNTIVHILSFLPNVY